MVACWAEATCARGNSHAVSSQLIGREAESKKGVAVGKPPFWTRANGSSFPWMQCGCFYCTTRFTGLRLARRTAAKKHLKKGVPFFKEEVTRSARLVYPFDEETQTILAEHCFATHKEYDN
ncbi:hypothetical protein AUJ65_05130 [Candidatus Micrarchaeota archaeon CG1_02_51_15]|nr:MAG: hypothetical protein AUJ65_05130 [Candidatus Micrarchaeota archaeon CG1_02_51_15]